MFEKGSGGMNRFFAGLAKNRYNRATAARGLDGEFLFGIVLALVTVVVLWWTPLLFPFRIFTVSAHEVSHALAAYAVGGKADRIELFWNGGGLTYIYGINGWLPAIVTYSAGYLGSVLFGGLLLLQSKRPENRRRILYFISGALLVVTALFIRDFTSLLLVGIAVALAGGVAYKAPNIVVMFMVYVMALLSCFNSVSDLLGLLFATSNPFHTGFNDAVGLQSATGIPALVWALVWGLLGAFMMFQFVRRALVRSASPKIGPATRPFSPANNGTAKDSPFDRYDEYLSKK